MLKSIFCSIEPKFIICERRSNAQNTDNKVCTDMYLQCTILAGLDHIV